MHSYGPYSSRSCQSVSQATLRDARLRGGEAPLTCHFSPYLPGSPPQPALTGRIQGQRLYFPPFRPSVCADRVCWRTTGWGWAAGKAGIGFSGKSMSCKPPLPHRVRRVQPRPSPSLSDQSEVHAGRVALFRFHARLTTNRCRKNTLLLFVFA